jgi:hypothetical protein
MEALITLSVVQTKGKHMMKLYDIQSMDNGSSQFAASPIMCGNSCGKVYGDLHLDCGSCLSLLFALR